MSSDKHRLHLEQLATTTEVRRPADIPLLYKYRTL